MDAETLLDEADGRLTRCVIWHPELRLEILKHQKHIQAALINPPEDLDGFMRKTMEWMTMLMVTMPDLDEHLRPVIEKIKFEFDRAATR